MVGKEDQDGTTYSGRDFRDAAITILRSLEGTATIGGHSVSVNGDLNKVRNVREVQKNPVASKMLDSVQATFRKIPGTQEVRMLMRHEITAFRVMYGMPLLITFAPNEKHNTLMLVLSRLRESDPMAKCDERLAKFGQLDQPNLVERPDTELNKVEIEIPIDSLKEHLPTMDERRKILSRDPLACVYGFHMLCRNATLTLT